MFQVPERRFGIRPPRRDDDQGELLGGVYLKRTLLGCKLPFSYIFYIFIRYSYIFVLLEMNEN